jgi:GNAT superfamily N-acetyltransferase
MAGMTGLVMRLLEGEEWPLARDLRVAAMRDSPTAFGSTVDRELSLSEDKWRGRLAGSAWFVACCAGEPLGLVSGVRVEPPDTRELAGMWVSPDWRGEGVSDALAVAVSEWAQADGAARLVLWVVETNAPALRLYARHGFSATGRRQALPSHPGLVEIEMSRDLEAQVTGSVRSGDRG